MRPARIISGVGLCGALVLTPWLLLTPASHSPPSESHVLRDVWQYCTATRQPLILRFAEPTLVGLGDPIYVGDMRNFRQVGEIRALYDAQGRVVPTYRTWVRSARASLYPQGPQLGAAPRITYVPKSQSFAWVLRTMLTEDHKRQLQEKYRLAVETHLPAVVEALKPAAAELQAELIDVVNQALPAAIERHRGEIELLGTKYREQILIAKLVPLAKSRVLPIAWRHAQAELTVVGRELWDRLPLFNFGMRALYDISPLPRRDLLDNAWKRYLAEDVTAVLQAHAEAFAAIARDIVIDMLRDPVLQQAAIDSLTTLARDPEMQHLLRELYREVVLERRWKTDEMRRAAAAVGELLEPTVREMGDVLFGTRAAGISPEFAEVLRAQVLLKDQRFFKLVVDPSGGPPPGSVDVSIATSE